MNVSRFLLFLFLLVFISCSNKKSKITYFTEKKEVDTAYALEKIHNLLALENIAFEISETKEDADLVIQLAEENSNNEGYGIEVTPSQKKVIAQSRRGLLYGLLDIANQLEEKHDWKAIQAKKVEAHYGFRAIKFNLPWYSYRSGANLSLHTEVCQDLTYWKSFLDMMVENKFNTLTLWNMHPFIYMVSPKSFPDASPFTNEELAEWQSFWKTLFKMAKHRGIDTYIINWNIFVSEQFAAAYNIGSYSKSSGYIGLGETNKMVEQYTRELVTQTINTYDDLTGIGITLGERMGGMTSEDRKNWIDRTIIAGLKAADREARLLYRAPLSAGKESHGTTSVSTEQLTREAIENMGLDKEVLIEFKFNWSHAHSSPKLSIVHGGILTDTYWQPESNKYKGVWTMRNEDFHMLRWAQPDFIRKFIQLNSQSYIKGCIIGSETYIPAKDYLTKPEFRTWDYAFERQWLFYKIWGNLLYDATTPDIIFEHELNKKFDIKEGKALLNAWKLASMNANRLASFYRGTWDATLYTEGFTTLRGEFIDIDQFINRPVLDSTYVNIKSYVANDFKETQITPDQLATITERESRQALAIVKRLRSRYPQHQALHIELADIDAWAYHGHYFATKIKAGIALERYRTMGVNSEKEEAIEQLTLGVGYWKQLVEAVETYNVSVFPYQFDQEFSWRKHLKSVEKELSMAKNISKTDILQTK